MHLILIEKNMVFVYKSAARKYLRSAQSFAL